MFLLRPADLVRRRLAHRFADGRAGHAVLGSRDTVRDGLPGHLSSPSSSLFSLKPSPSFLFFFFQSAKIAPNNDPDRYGGTTTRRDFSGLVNAKWAKNGTDVNPPLSPGAWAKKKEKPLLRSDFFFFGVETSLADLAGCVEGIWRGCKSENT